MNITGYRTVKDVIEELQKYPEEMRIRTANDGDLVNITEISETTETYRDGDDIWLEYFVAIWSEKEDE